MSDILRRRQTQFVLWSPASVASSPELIIGQLQNGNPPKFTRLARKALQRAAGDVGTPGGLFELDASNLGLADGQTYHYWFEVQDTSPGGSGRVQITDPLAAVVDYRLYAPDNPSLIHPASVIGFSGGRLVVRDPNGEAPEPKVANFDALAPNNRLVIYELPTASSPAGQPCRCEPDLVPAIRHTWASEVHRPPPPYRWRRPPRTHPAAPRGAGRTSRRRCPFRRLSPVNPRIPF